MSDSADPNGTGDEGEKRSVWLVIGVFVTAVYLAFFGFVVLPSAATCSSIGPMPSWFSSTFSCMTLNEMGDLFAGASAPLAFIWLAVAVLIQAQELRAQRAELRLTRIEYAAARSVLSDQTDLLGRQTELLVSQNAAREAGQEETKIISMLADFCSALAGNPTIPRHLEYTDAQGVTRTAGDLIPSKPVSELGVAKYLMETCRNLVSLNKVLKQDGRSVKCDDGLVTELKSLLDQLNGIVGRLKSASQEFQQRHEATSVVELQTLLDQHLAILQANTEARGDLG